MPGCVSEGQWDNWENSFNGKYHCEALMTSLRNIDLEAIERFSKKGRMPEFKRLSHSLKVLPHFHDRPYHTDMNMQACSHLVGVSKGCCFLCGTYILAVKSVKVRGCSGKVFPWAMPPWETDRDIHKRMWIAVRKKILRTMWMAHILPGNRRLSGSDSG